MGLFSTGNLFAQKPIISLFSPTKGLVGSTVTISGADFSTTPMDNIVYFGDIKATVLTATGNSINVLVPAGAAYKPISVTVNGLTAYSSIPFTVTFPGDGNRFSTNSYAAKVDSSWGFLVNSIGSSDLDGDGDLDPVLVSTNSNFISVLKNNSSIGSISLSYSQSSNYTTGASPASVSFADLDGDGKRDIIVVNSTGNSLSVFKNSSTLESINLLPKIDFPAGGSPALSTIGDIDNDGKPDIICTNSGSNNISVFRNISSGGVISFAQKTDFATGKNPFGLIHADIDGDGIGEVVVANRDDFSMSIFKNSSSPGTVSLGNRTDISGIAPLMIEAADLDSDGKTDIVATTMNASSVAVLRNTSIAGSISFGPVQEFRTGFGSPTYLTIGDIDGDGKPDLAVNHAIYSTISIIKNLSQSGTISLSTNTDFYVAGSSLTILLSDLDNDARPDLISGNTNLSAISILRNLVPKPIITSFTPTTGGNGTAVSIAGNNFNTTSQVSFGGIPSSNFIVQSSNSILAIVDTGLAGDVAITTAYGVAKIPGFDFSKAPAITSFSPSKGDKDTVVTINGTNFSNVTAVSFGSVPATSFSIISPTTILATVGSLPPGNFDISITNPSGNTAMGNFYTGVTINSFYPNSGPVGTVVTINGTHFSSNPSDNIVYFGSVRASVLSSTQTSLLVSVPPGSSYQPITVTVNNLTAYSAAPFIVTFKGTGNEFTQNSFGDRVDSSAGAFPVHASIADLNSDGKSDVIVSNFGSNFLSVVKNTSTNGNTSFQRKVEYALSNPSHNSTVGDLDGDGYPEIILGVQNSSTGGGFISFLKNISAPDTIILTKTEYTIGSSNDYPKVSVIADFDGDGNPDPAGLTSTGIAILRNTSTSGTISFASKIDTVFSQIVSSSIAAGDVDGDGKPDFVINSQYLDSLHVIINTSKPGQISFARKVNLPSGSSPVSIALGDLDNDARPEIVVLNRGNNSVSIYKNRSTVGLVAFENRIDYPLNVVPWGTALGDFDGDGRLDISFVTRLDKFIYVLKNTSSFSGISFADKISFEDPYTPGHVSIADINNDGKADIIATNSSDANNFSVLVNKCDDDGLPAALIQPSGPTTFCEGGSVDLKTSSINNAAYQWYKDGSAITSANDSVLTINAAGIYSVRITSNGNVFASAPYVVSVKPIPPAPVLSLIGTANLCQGMASFLHSSAKASNEWYKDNILLAGITASLYMVSAPGKYKVVVNGNGCFSTFSNEVTIVNKPAPSPVITASANTICNADSVILNANLVNGSTYQWNNNDEQLPGATSSRLVSKSGGNFSVTETNNGCSASSEIVTITKSSSPPKPSITLTGTSLRSSAQNGNQWFHDGVAINGATAQVYSPTVSGNYSVQVTQNGCKSSVSNAYAFVVTSVVTIDNIHFIKLSPNPVVNEMILDFNLEGVNQVNIDLLDLNGRLIKRWMNQKKGSRLYISNYAKSVYIARVYSGNGKINAALKLIRQ